MHLPFVRLLPRNPSPLPHYPPPPLIVGKMVEVHSRDYAKPAPPFSAWDWAKDNARIAEIERAASHPPAQLVRRRRIAIWWYSARWRILDLCRAILRLPRDDI